VNAAPQKNLAEELQAKVDAQEAELDELRAQLDDAEQTLEAIRQGQVDALVIDSSEGQKIFSLTGAERPYRTIIEQMTEGAVTLDNEGSIRYCNRAFAELLRRPLEDMTGGFVDQYVQGVDRDFFLSMLQQSRSTGMRGEIGLETVDGNVVPVYVSLTPIFDSGPESVCMVVTDLTERKHAERTSSSEQFVQGLIEAAPIGVAVVDQNLRYVLANPVYRLLARNALVTGRSIEEVFAPPIVRIVGPLVRQVLDTDQALHVPECAVSDDVEGWWNISLVPLHEPGGAVTSVLIVAEDITVRKQAETGLLRSQDALRDADRRKDEFLATLAHELRNPLAPIRTAAQILGSPKLAAQQLQWAHNVIQRQVGHMALLLDDLLDIARITRGKLEVRKERVRLTEVVDSAVEAARPLLDGKHHHFSVTLPAAELWLEADPLRLSQVLSNLLTNSAKYTDPAGHIELSVSVQDHLLCLSVKDDGIGIAPESLNKIFEMFSQVDSASARSEGGLGIGLALVKGIVDLHGGTVGARSAGPGLGSEFTVSLPLAPAEAVATASNPNAPPLAVTGLRVIVADDNKDAADALAMLLELSGHEVRVAHGGRAALSLAQTFRPDVVILDIGMPDLSGYEVAEQLRREPWGESIMLIALTGWGRDDDRQRATAAGFDQHMTKPVDPEKLEALISKCRLRRCAGRPELDCN
jgi:PAS domain S-box-containing protein